MTRIPDISGVLPDDRPRDLPKVGRNGEIRYFLHEREDGAEAFVGMRRVANRRFNTWEVTFEHWYVFSGNWSLKSNLPVTHEEYLSINHESTQDLVTTWLQQAERNGSDGSTR